MLFIVVTILSIIVTTILSINTISNQNKIRDLNNYINLTRTNGTIHLDSYYYGIETGINQSVEMFIKAIEEGRMIYYLDKNGNGIAVDLSNCDKGEIK